MGADLAFENRREAAGEMVADIRVRHGELCGVDVPASRVPSMIDEYPVLAALAAFARGETRMRGLAELRVKESDRLEASRAGLEKGGVRARIEGDDLIVEGGGGDVRGRGDGEDGGLPGGGEVKTHMDHRLAMSFLVLGLGAAEGARVVIDDASMIETSFPGFLEIMNGLGAEYETANAAAGGRREND
jgi:3-phosphoshikimate 1-carboxyvinyltransferase